MGTYSGERYGQRAMRIEKIKNGISMNRLKQMITLFVLFGLTPIIAQKVGYINDSDGYTNLRLEPSGKSEIAGIIIQGQEFKYYPDKNSDWWKVEFQFRSGFMHKSRIKDFNDVKTEISNFFKEFHSTDRNNAEAGETNNEKLFLLTQDYPLAASAAFCEQNKEVQDFLVSEYEKPVHDLIDLQLVYSRLINLEIPCADINKIIKALELAGEKSGMVFQKNKIFDSNIPDYNKPDKFSQNVNHWFVSDLDGKPITFYLNNPSIDTYAKMFYQGQFTPFDDSLTFTFLDSVLTTNPETKNFYLFVFNSVLKLADGSLAESIGSECRSYFENYPCDFINLKSNPNYSDNYQKWIDFAGYEYYFEEDPVKSINNSIDSVKPKVMADCKEKLKELEEIKIRLIDFIKENEYNKP